MILLSYLDAIHDTGETVWTAAIKINDHETVFKLDTGAEANAVSTKTFESLKGIKLEKPVKVLCGPNGQSLKVVGQAAVQLTYRGKSCTQPFYVIDDLKSNLLGLPAIIQHCRSLSRWIAYNQVTYTKAFLSYSKA